MTSQVMEKEYKQKGAMEQKVNRMRSQKMSFANDGMEISLDIPDTTDVKDTFGSVISTIVEQEDEIVGLQSNLKQVVDENTASQAKIVAWTKKCVQQLQEQNMALQQKLNDAQTQIKNFAYNIQGFVDDTPIEASIKPTVDIAKITREFTLDIPPSASGVSFRTEAGANPDSIDGSLSTIDVQTNNGESIPRRKKTNTAKMAAQVMYHSVKKNMLPPSIAGRWRWAINKIIVKNRQHKLKLGFNHTRIERSQTVNEKISRMETDLFKIPLHVNDLMTVQGRELNERIDSEVHDINKKITQMIEEKADASSAMDETINQLENKIANMDSKMQSIVELIEKKSKDDNKKLTDTISNIEKTLKDVVSLDFNRFRVGLADLKKQLDDSEQKSETLTRDISGMITASKEIKTKNVTVEANADPAKHLVDMIQLDLILRTTRTQIATLESNVDVSAAVFQSLKQHIDSFITHFVHGASTNEDAANDEVKPKSFMSSAHLNELSELQLRSASTENHFKHIRQNINRMREQCNSHDLSLSTKYNALNQITATSTDVAALTTALANTSTELNEFKATTTESTTAATAQNVMEHEKSNAEILNLTKKLMKSEKNLINLSKTQSQLQSQLDTLAASSMSFIEPGAVSTANETPISELENKLKPLIAKMLAESGGGGGGGGGPMRHHSPHQQSGQHHINSGPNSPNVSRRTSVAVGAAANAVTGNRASPQKHSPTSQQQYVQQQQQQQQQQAMSRRNSSAKSNMSNRPDSSKGLHPSVRTPAASFSVPGFVQQYNDEGSVDGSDVDKAPPAEPQSPLNTRQISAKKQSTMSKINTDLHSDGGSAGMSDDGEFLNDEDYGEDTQNDNTQEGGQIYNDEVVSRGGSLIGSFVNYNMGGGTGNTNFDPSSLIYDIGSIKDENSMLGRKLEEIAAERLTADQAELLIKQIYREEKRLEQKTNQAVAVEDIDKHIREIVKELVLVRKEHERDIHILRSQFDSALVSALNQAVAEVDDSKTLSILNTRSLCLSCGRSSQVSANAGRPISPTFLPTINTHIAPGPDIYRGGFKMPVRHGSPGSISSQSVIECASATLKRKVFGVSDLHGSSSISTSVPHTIPPLVMDDTLHTTETGGGIDLQIGFNSQNNSLVEGGGDDVSVVPSVTLDAYMGVGSVSFPVHIEGGTTPRRISSAAATAIRHAQGRHESEELRPIYRGKGFPGKKSMRAETTYAPERFDLPGSKESMLKVTRISNLLHDRPPPRAMSSQGSRMHSSSVNSLK